MCAVRDHGMTMLPCLAIALLGSSLMYTSTFHAQCQRYIVYQYDMPYQRSDIPLKISRSSRRASSSDFIVALSPSSEKCMSIPQNSGSCADPALRFEYVSYSNRQTVHAVQSSVSNHPSQSTSGSRQKTLACPSGEVPTADHPCMCKRAH